MDFAQPTNRPDPDVLHGPVPMFPLPGVFLFPRQILPLHVFEPRYRQMVEDSLDGPGRIVMGTIQGDSGPPGSRPPVLQTAGLGEIARHEKLPDGRFLIWLFGLARVRIEESESDRLYRKVRFRVVEELRDPTVEETLEQALGEALAQRIADDLKLPEDPDVGALADLLLQSLDLPQREMERIFSEPSVPVRARAALQAHRRSSSGGDGPNLPDA